MLQYPMVFVSLVSPLLLSMGIWMMISYAPFVFSVFYACDVHGSLEL